jgi:hypothetical protein
VTSVFACGFECGVKGGNVGEHWASASAATSFSTSTVRSGARSLRVNPTAAVSFALSSGGLFTGGTKAVSRIYINIASHPTTDTLIYGVLASGAYVGLVYQSSDQKYYAGADTAGTLTVGSSGATLATGRWYCIDSKSDVANNPWTIDGMVDGVAIGQATNAVAATTFSAVSAVIRLGSNGSTETFDIFYDDLVLSLTAADYPIGAGYINHFVPTADGTHNIAGTGDFQRTLTGTDILNATTTAWQLVDEVPLEAVVTDWINMLAPINATDYVECIFGPASGVAVPIVPPRAVEVICGINQAATGAGNIEIRLNDNGTTNAVYSATGVAGVAVATGQQFKRKHYAAGPAGAWAIGGGGNGDFTDLRIRFGSPAALDVNPDQYFGCAMIEADFPYYKPRPPLNLQQAVNRAGNF